MNLVATVERKYEKSLDTVTLIVIIESAESKLKEDSSINQARIE